MCVMRGMIFLIVKNRGPLFWNCESLREDVFSNDHAKHVRVLPRARKDTLEGLQEAF